MGDGWSQTQGRGSPSSSFKTQHIGVVEQPSQSPDLNPTENLWQYLKAADHKRSPSNLTELEMCEEKWPKLVETNPKRLVAVIAAKGRSTNY